MLNSLAAAMEDSLAGVISALAALAGFLIGNRFLPKNKSMLEAVKWYKDELDNLRTELKRYRAKVSYFQKGAVPSELGGIDDPARLVDGIIDNLPTNYRLLLQPLKGQIKDLVKDNPQLIEYAPALIQRFLGNKGEEAQAATTPNDAL